MPSARGGGGESGEGPGRSPRNGHWASGDPPPPLPKKETPPGRAVVPPQRWLMQQTPNPNHHTRRRRESRGRARTPPESPPGGQGLGPEALHRRLEPRPAPGSSKYRPLCPDPRAGEGGGASQDQCQFQKLRQKPAPVGLGQETTCGGPMSPTLTKTTVQRPAPSPAMTGGGLAPVEQSGAACLCPAAALPPAPASCGGLLPPAAAAAHRRKKGGAHGSRPRARDTGSRVVRRTSSTGHCFVSRSGRPLSPGEAGSPRFVGSCRVVPDSRGLWDSSSAWFQRRAGRKLLYGGG